MRKAKRGGEEKKRWIRLCSEIDAELDIKNKKRLRIAVSEGREELR